MDPRTRHGGDAARLQAMLEGLSRFRDRVLDNARIREGDAVLDVGCGDGLIGFGALERVGPTGQDTLCADLPRR